MSSPPPHKRQKSSTSASIPVTTAEPEGSLPPAPVPAPIPSSLPPSAPLAAAASLPFPAPPPRLPPVNAEPPAAANSRSVLDTAPPPVSMSAAAVAPTSPINPRKRRSSRSPKLDTLPPGTSLPSEASAVASISNLLSEDPVKKRTGRTNTPWTAAEELRLKNMRDAGKSWGEIAKAFPNRTEGSVKKHWYKDMHYAEFAEDESIALREAIKEYEANKWKAIGQKLNKPAKACEQYAREHFKNL